MRHCTKLVKKQSRHNGCEQIANHGEDKDEDLIQGDKFNLGKSRETVHFMIVVECPCAGLGRQVLQLPIARLLPSRSSTGVSSKTTRNRKC